MNKALVEAVTVNTPPINPVVYIRQRKIERIAQLDSEVAQLKLENQGLEQVGGPQRTRGALRMRR